MARAPNRAPEHPAPAAAVGPSALEPGSMEFRGTWIFGRNQDSSCVSSAPSSAPLTAPRRRSWPRNHETPSAPGQTATAHGAGNTGDNTGWARLLAVPAHPDQRSPHHRFAARRRRFWSLPGVAEGFGRWAASIVPPLVMCLTVSRCPVRGARGAILDPLRHPLGIPAAVHQARDAGVGRRQGGKCAYLSARTLTPLGTPSCHAAMLPY